MSADCKQALSDENLSISLDTGWWSRSLVAVFYSSIVCDRRGKRHHVTGGETGSARHDFRVFRCIMRLTDAAALGRKWRVCWSPCELFSGDRICTNRRDTVFHYRHTVSPLTLIVHTNRRRTPSVFEPPRYRVYSVINNGSVAKVRQTNINIECPGMRGC